MQKRPGADFQILPPAPIALVKIALMRLAVAGNQLGRFLVGQACGCPCKVFKWKLAPPDAVALGIAPGEYVWLPKPSMCR